MLTFKLRTWQQEPEDRYHGVPLDCLLFAAQLECFIILHQQPTLLLVVLLVLELLTPLAEREAALAADSQLGQDLAALNTHWMWNKSISHLIINIILIYPDENSAWVLLSVAAPAVWLGLITSINVTESPLDLRWRTWPNIRGSHNILALSVFPVTNNLHQALSPHCCCIYSWLQLTVRSRHKQSFLPGQVLAGLAST